jgi:two-component system cell cycle response regulator
MRGLMALAHTPPVALHPRRPRLLIVDDCRTSLLFQELVLQPRYQVLTARDAASALALLEREPIDLILLDLRLPDLDGLEVLRRLRTGSTPRIPVLVVSVQGAPGQLEAAFALGCDGYLTKPASAGDLVAQVERILRG